MSSLARIYATHKAGACTALAATAIMLVTACSGDRAEPAVVPSKYEIRPQSFVIDINSSVEFELYDRKSGNPVPAIFKVSSPHNVPGDRGIFIESVYTAPRWVPSEHFVTIKAISREADVEVEYPLEITGNGVPRAHEEARPGGPYMPLKRVSFDPPVEGGLKLGASTQIVTDDGWGAPLIVAYYQVQHQNEVIDYAGTISENGIYTAPLILPDPPHVRINVYYYRESGEPGSIGLIGPPIALIP